MKVYLNLYENLIVCFHRGMSGMFSKSLSPLALAYFISFAIQAAPQRISTVRYPLEFSESAVTHPILIGASNIQISSTKENLELVIWKTNSSFALEVNINVKGVNQSILPTDENGKLLAKVTQLGAVPWIKVYLPGHPPQTLDVKCDSKSNICQGVWKNYPFDPIFEGVVKIEANIRGLEGKVWSPQLSSLVPTLAYGKQIGLETATLNPPYSLPAKSKIPPARVEVTRFYDLLRFPAEFANLKLLSIFTWKFLNDSQLRSSGYFRVLRRTLFHIDKGQALLDVLTTDSLQTFEVLQDQSFWANSKHILSFSGKKLGNQSETHIRVLEFEE